MNHRLGHADEVRLVVPRISSFYGITIWMYFDELRHSGRPHFHARYGEDEASIDIESLETLAGRLPTRARRLVVEWALEHRTQLRDNWMCAREGNRSSRSSRCDRPIIIATCAVRHFSWKPRLETTTVFRCALTMG
jgi:hypothetical protein